ncbi:MAG: hypothetical protein OI74_14545 [Gammaproteobacteria bacterium (ex Lamellibrachia satsuma)]|nr:MAG: TIR domain-containing protein [Gammaproteobacteria bacterium (ex Lamellibrachia satsuma)]RRS31286.1 MAG: hypothetical protein OI74_14545 [Gammaproteobacteria bacterium (ex Lamellibrachia satsuma)]RRS36971.1 MAG: hypothetical protein NV67_04185 [Gammaproteobacteria bacterium (ex Lamellibrachia satsuma)]
MPNAHLFLSYSHLEDAFALRLAADLREAGVQLWMDRLDAALVTGEDWRRAIEKSLDASAGMLAVVSPAYVESDYCLKELARAADRKKRIYPVLLRPVPQPPLDLQLAQRVDFTRANDSNCYSAALAKLIHDIEATEGLDPRLDPVSSYLLHLIAEMESIKGVHDFVALAGEAEDTTRHLAVRPPPRVMAAWGLEGEFALIGDAPDMSGSIGIVQPAHVESIAEALDHFSRFILLGAPGAGKTTTLRRVAMEAARERLSKRSAPLPLLLRLPAWANESTFEDFLRAHWPFDSDPLDAVDSLLLLLDGLNEMGAFGSTKAAALKGFLAREPDCRVVVTCRSGDYGAELDLELPCVEVQPMDEARVRRFATAYLENDAEEFLERIGLQEVQFALTGGFAGGSRRLVTLARNPYLLVALMAVSRESATGALPANPGVLFRKLVAVLWEREHRRQTAGWVPYADIVDRLSALAREVLTKGLSTELSEEVVTAHADSELVEVACRASLLEHTEQGTRFYHQLMQEYFAAEACPVDVLLAHVEAATFDGVVGLSRGPWDEVIIAKAGLLPNADELVDGLVQTNPYLAAEAVASGILVGDAVRFRLTEKLVAVFGAALPAWEWPPDTVETEMAIRSLGAIGAVDAVEPIIGALEINNTGIIAAACDALAEIGDASAAQPLISQLGGWDNGDKTQRPPSMRRKIFAQIADSAEQALIRLGEAGVPSCIDALGQRSHYNDNSLAALLYILGRIGSPRAVEPIMEFSKTLLPFSVAMANMDVVRAYTFQALGRLRAKQAIPLLAKALGEDSLDPESLPYAELWGGQPNLSERLSLQAARALALIDTEDAREVLRAHGLPDAPVPIFVPDWAVQ